MRRVVVTGLGLVTPLASGVEETWTRLLDGQSGAGPITHFDASNVATKYACEIPYGDGTDGTFNPDDWMEPKERRKVDDFILYGIAAAEMAVRDSGWVPEDEEGRLRTGVMIGSGIGGLQSIAETSLVIKEKGPRRVSPFFIPGALINLISGQVSIKHGFKGPNHSVVTACSTGAHAIGDAARLIMTSDADVMVAGGAEAAICEIGIAGFNACKALSTKRADEPEKASRPYDADRDGFVMGEGAGIVVLEEYEVERMMGDAAGKLTMTSTKSATGHLLGAAGAIEAIFTILAIRDQVAPPTINLDNVAVETPVDLAPNAKREREINYALSNSFGFGGTNASLLLGRVS
ncbi:MAG: beta-ketoacyl-ACP synthase II [Rhodobacteraceae bacterium]|nr:beta-ketoacyl-ACP synthase II [Paracoccaceae bacterium]